MQFLMCPPEYYQCEYEINPWMVGNIGKVDKILAEKQWNALYEVLKRHADIDLIEPHHTLPDMVFTANAGIVLPERNIFVVSKMSKPERRKEQYIFGQWAREHGYHVRMFDQPHKPDDYFEGEGDCIRNGDHFVFGEGQRTTINAEHLVFDALTTDTGYDPVLPIAELRKYTKGRHDLKDPRFYHLDTCYMPLSKAGMLLAFRHAFGFVLWNPNTSILISEADAIRFACNGVVVGDLIVMPLTSPGLKLALEKKGYKVIQLDMSEFIKAGGACKCLTLTLDYSL